MKYLISSFLYLLIFSVNIFPQFKIIDKSITDDGLLIGISFDEEPYLLEGSNKNVINFFNSLDESKSIEPILPSRTLFIAIPPESKINVEFIEVKKGVINNIIPKANPKIFLNGDSTLNYSDANLDLTLSQTEIYPKEKYSIEGYTWIRNYYCAVLRVNTYRYNWQLRQIDQLKEVKIQIKYLELKPFLPNNSPTDEFEKFLEKVIINFDEAKQFRSFPTISHVNDSTGNWIDYSREYVKLQIPNDAVYRIDYNDILSYGIPQNVNPKSFKIYSKGIEIQLYVFGEDDNSFDQGDYIEFWSEKNYRAGEYRHLVTQGEEYLTYYDIYSDTAIVWLTWDGNFGKRTQIVSDYTPGLVDSITSHKVKIHMENDLLLWYYGYELPRIQLPFWHECKTWVWKQVTNTGTSSSTFVARDFVPNTNVYTISRLNSWATSNSLVTNAHKFGAKMNSTGIQDSVIFNYQTIANLEAIFNSNDLIPGTNNYRVSGMPNDSGFAHRALIDWIDIEYFQFTNAVNDSLLITVPDSVLTGPRVIKVNNFIANQDSVLIFKIKINETTKKFNSFQINNNTLTFTDTVTGGDKYFILKQIYLKKPIYLNNKQFENLRDQNKQADYILITQKSLQSSANDYEDFIETNYSNSNSFSVENVLVEDIYDEFGYGYEKPEPVKEFLKYAYFNWQSPKPVYLTLLGDCTYDYKNRFGLTPSLKKEILVPSYGNSVSDVWFTTWDTTNINLQQMLVGRIPANNNEEVYNYLEKHQLYVQRDFDDWNKNFLLFSGGFTDDPNELEQIRQANLAVLNNVIKPFPVGGNAVHFYKTISPPTNFGPYTPEQIESAIDYGGLFISYIGHSGTRTWDNGIREPSDLMNSYNDRFPVVSDNGCSTGKFAEPDVDAFGELFTTQDPTGQAIAYTGNSSLGYTSTAFRMPQIFYKRLISDSTMNIGAAHFLSKMDNFSQSGFNDVNRLYNYCNILLGDPVIKFSFPEKPNFVVNQASVTFPEEVITDVKDSIDAKLILLNWGRVVADSLELTIESIYADTTLNSLKWKVGPPFYSDTLELKIPILQLAGEHKIRIELDENNLIEELNELDNLAEIRFLVYSTKLRPIEEEYFYNTSRSTAGILNQTISFDDQSNEIELAISQDPEFSSQQIFTKQLDSVATFFQFSNLLPNKRYYWHARINNSGQEWGQTISFFTDKDYSWFLGNSFNLGDIITEKVSFDSIRSAWSIDSSFNILKVSSAGSNDGEYGSIIYNFIEMLPVTFYWGIATAILDSQTLEPLNFNYFLYSDSDPADSMNNYLNSLYEGTIIAMAICADGAQSVFNRTGGAVLRETIKNFGSVYVDSIQYRDSWAIIGVKGALPGSVPEDFAKRLLGSASVDTSKSFQNTLGTIQFPVVTNALTWTSVFKEDSIPAGTSINYYPLGYKNDGSVDTLNQLNFVGNEASIEFIDAEVYRKISLLAELNANSEAESPELKSLGINFIPPPELAINYQVVSVSKDSVLVGEDITLKFYVFNVGKTSADSFYVRAELIQPDNSREILLNQFVSSLQPDEKKLFEYTYNTSEASGEKTFEIRIDPENEVRELFEDNNFFSIPFYIRPDTTQPTITMTIDGSNILDGEYISPTPIVHIELNDQSLLPITDPSSVLIYLNEELIPSDTSIIAYQFSTTNPKVVVDFSPILKDGEYHLKVLWKDSGGNIVDSSGVEKYFLVSNEAKIINVYNYPNPTSGETHFTFKLTQIPDEIRIKIFTIAGRLVKELTLNSSQLRFDFNKIYWDGRDEDGDLLANGVYLYKIIMQAGDKTEDITQKLAIVK